MPLLERLMPGVGRLLEKGRFPEERRIAICVMDDILEHAPGGAAKYMTQVRDCVGWGEGRRVAGAAALSVATRQCGAGCAGMQELGRGEM